jgi:hypothetical protein
MPPISIGADENELEAYMSNFRISVDADEDNSGFAYAFEDLEPLANEYAALHKVSIAKKLGSGSYGQAFLTDNNKVIKITRDKVEFAYALKLRGINNEYVANIFHCHRFDDNHFAIMQEFLEPADNYFGTTHVYYIQLVDYKETGKRHKTMDDVSAERMAEMELLYTSLQEAAAELNRAGLTALDIRDENIGMKNGHFALFDQTDLSVSIENRVGGDMLTIYNWISKKIDDELDREYRHYEQCDF